MPKPETQMLNDPKDGVRRSRHVRLSRTGRSQALRIPKELELPGVEAVIRTDGDLLIVEPVEKPGLLAVLASLQPLDEAMPNTDQGLAPLAVAVQSSPCDLGRQGFGADRSPGGDVARNSKRLIRERFRGKPRH